DDISLSGDGRGGFRTARRGRRAAVDGRALGCPLTTTGQDRDQNRRWNEQSAAHHILLTTYPRAAGSPPRRSIDEITPSGATRACTAAARRTVCTGTRRAARPARRADRARDESSTDARTRPDCRS